MPLQEQREELQRIIQSPQFRRAPKLQRLLTLVCEYFFEGRPQEINEFLIATEAFGKGQDFDASQDSIVRVQAREARRRLREYYQGPGTDSRLILDIPVGSYVPVFTAAESGGARRRAPLIKAAWAVPLAVSLLVTVIVLSADFLRLRSVRDSSAASASKSSDVLGPSLAGLWNRFVDSDAPTILVLSNPAVSSCTPEENAARPGSPPSPQATCPDEYTGIGEAVALHLVTRIFKNTKQKLTVKQSRTLNADDIQRSNLILLGGKLVNPWTQKLGPDIDLPAELPPASAGKRDPHRYETVFDSKTGGVTKDRAIIALRKNTATGHWLLFLWGAHSQGTQSVAEAATDERFLSQLKWPQPAPPFPDRFHILVGVTLHDTGSDDNLPVAVRVP
jgi:hypothetical protein